MVKKLDKKIKNSTKPLVKSLTRTKVQKPKNTVKESIKKIPTKTKKMIDKVKKTSKSALKVREMKKPLKVDVKLKPKPKRKPETKPKPANKTVSKSKTVKKEKPLKIVPSVKALKKTKSKKPKQLIPWTYDAVKDFNHLDEPLEAPILLSVDYYNKITQQGSTLVNMELETLKSLLYKWIPKNTKIAHKDILSFLCSCNKKYAEEVQKNNISSSDQIKALRNVIFLVINPSFSEKDIKTLGGSESFSKLEYILLEMIFLSNK